RIQLQPPAPLAENSIAPRPRAPRASAKTCRSVKSESSRSTIDCVRRERGDHRGRPSNTVASPAVFARPSTRERVRPDLELEHLRLSVDPALAVEVGASARGGPQASALPTAVWIVDTAVGVLGEEAHRIRNPQGHELAVDDGGERFAAVGRGN